jgi:hypothetical protein
VTTLDRAQGEVSHRWPLVTPDGTLIFTAWTGPGPDERAIVAQPIGGGPRRVLVRGGDMARYAPQGYLVYARLDQLFAVPWRPSDKEMGTAPPIALPVYPHMEGEGAAAYAISQAGTLACVTGGAARYEQRLVWIDPSGTIEPLPLPARDYESVSISPDGTRALVQIREGTMGLWIYDFARHTLTPIATGNRSSQAGVWTPDGKAIIYRGTRNGERNAYWRAADGTGDEQRLTTGDGSETPTAVTPDGRFLVYNIQGRRAGGRQILSIRLDGPRPATPQVVVSEDGLRDDRIERRRRDLRSAVSRPRPPDAGQRGRRPQCALVARWTPALLRRRRRARRGDRPGVPGLVDRRAADRDAWALQGWAEREDAVRHFP